MLIHTLNQPYASDVVHIQESFDNKGPNSRTFIIFRFT